MNDPLDFRETFEEWYNDKKDREHKSDNKNDNGTFIDGDASVKNCTKRGNNEDGNECADGTSKRSNECLQ